MYTTQAKIEAYSGTTIPAAQVAQLTNWITAVQKWIDNYIGYGFEDVVATHKIFDGSGSKTLFVDTFYSATSITTMDSSGENDVAVDMAYVIQYPINSMAKNRLEIIDGCNISKWPDHKYAVDVEALWGGSNTVPEDIELVATMIMSDMLADASGSGDAESESLGDYSISYGTSDIEESADKFGIKSILDQYRNIEL